MGRININSTIADSILAICEGNPGAMAFVMELIGEGDMLTVLMFDKLELYGEKLYMLWNDCCGREIENVRKVIDLWQQGKITKETIQEHVSGGYGKPFQEIEKTEN